MENKTLREEIEQNRRARKRQAWMWLIAAILALFIVGLIMFIAKTEKEEPASVTEWSTPAKPEKQIEYIYVKENDTYSDYAKTLADSSYWYCVVIVKKDGKQVTWHTAVNLPVPYFDFVLANEDLEETGQYYYKTIVQISKQGFDSFYKMVNDERYK